ncbi:MAG: carboxypeptidase-like regulatory domain-containing protein [Flavobacteriales bacterium]|nr:carboxypeptidase-like regulatory domain-containing protein [Flavobacteriales bacterium]MCB9167406.1 carboxypeptidase-like regulatory domain-containing protein [Flavobacteriales bacterium]
MSERRSLWPKTLGFALLATSVAHAQTTIVEGNVTDARTGETLPFVNIAFVNSRVGTISDIDGNYRLESYYATDSVRASFVGYEPTTVGVKKDREQHIDLVLQPRSTQLQEVVIKPQERNPAFEILDRLVANKPANNREKLSSYSYDAYNKVEFDLNNVPEKWTTGKLFRPFAFVFDYIDSTDEKPYLPIFITETLSDVYYRQEPKTTREYIRATKVSGIENESISQLMGDMYQNVNIYDNILVIFNKNFISPIADGGRSYYDYYLTDSSWVDRHWCYRMEFKPKRRQELTFDGYMLIADTSYAVKYITARIALGANVNYVHGFRVEQEYDQVEDEVWMLKRDALVVDLSLLKRKKFQGFYGRRTATYDDFTINQEAPEEKYAGNERVIMVPDSGSTSDDYWQDHRPEALSKQEADIYKMVDSVKTVPRFRTFVDVVNMLITGYYTKGNVEFGPYYTFYSSNTVEGPRFKFGLRTSNKFSRRVEFEGYTAYGLLDREFKGMVGGQGFITKDPRQILGVYLKHDIEQLGQSQSAFRSDNILSSTFRSNPANKLTLVNEVRASYEREWFSGFNNLLMARYRELYPRGDLEYLHPVFEGNGINVLRSIPRITSFELSLNTRFAYQEKYVAGEFRRVSLGTRFPAFEVHVAYGFPGLFGSQYEYTKLIGRVEQKVPLGVLGTFDYTVEAGRIWGTLPYPLLILHTGNETFYNYDDAFNTMNFFEFISDRYAQVMAEQHFEGLLLNHIPLLRKLRWREVVTAKAVVGDLDPKHGSELLFLPGMYSLRNGAYAEVAVGIENILNIIRIDGVWRLTYLDHPDITPFAIRLKFKFDF